MHIRPTVLFTNRETGPGGMHEPEDVGARSCLVQVNERADAEGGDHRWHRPIVADRARAHAQQHAVLTA